MTIKSGLTLMAIHHWPKPVFIPIVNQDTTNIVHFLAITGMDRNLHWVAKQGVSKPILELKTG